MKKKEEMAQQSEIDNIGVGVPAGGFITAYIKRITIGSANNKYFEYLIKIQTVCTTVHTNHNT